MTIMAGWRSAVAIARKALEEAAVDHGADQVLFKEDLLNIARTTLSSKVTTASRRRFPLMDRRG
jgi:T-complex protein 1 subunit beta